MKSCNKFPKTAFGGKTDTVMASGSASPKMKKGKRGGGKNSFPKTAFGNKSS